MFCSEHCLKTDEVKARVPRTPSQPSSSRPQSPPVAVALPYLVPVSRFVPWLLKGQEDEQSLVFYHLQAAFAQSWCTGALLGLGVPLAPVYRALVPHKTPADQEKRWSTPQDFCIQGHLSCRLVLLITHTFRPDR